jgi:hypothetical protein
LEDHLSATSSCYLRVVLTVFTAAVLAVLPGCGGGGPAGPTGSVAGKVTFEGKPVTEGHVSFLNETAGAGDEAPLKSDGSYAVAKPLPTGEYKVMVIPPIIKMQVDGKGPEVDVEAPAPNIPPKYRVIGTTDLRANVKEGKNEVNLEMKR